MVDYLHLDVMDSHFVPQLSFGESYSLQISKITSIPLDIHLMVSNPEKEVPKYFVSKPKIISFHIEASSSPIRLAQTIRSEGILAGIAINPATPIERIEPLLDEIDLILLMSVEPGYCGQTFLPRSLARIRNLKSIISSRDGDKIYLEVDGGIHKENIKTIWEAGADIAVAGSACFTNSDVNSNVQKLKDECVPAPS